MDNFAYIKNLLLQEKIDTFGAIKLSDCKIMREYKLKNAGLDISDSLFVYIFAMPYYAKDVDDKNISMYAVPRDYHAYFNGLSKRLVTKLQENFPEYKFAAFTDNSPIDERHAAASAGLGVIGKNGLLITEKYSSFIFLGEIITNMPTQMYGKTEIKECIGCGKCTKACPMSEIGECLSSLTQKKGALTDEEIKSIQKYGCAWGCDICQDTCPYTQKAIKNGTIYTPIDFFSENLTPKLDKDTILSMSDEEFSLRAYSWRKKETILRNLEILSK